MGHPTRIALVIRHELNYCRAVLLGIKRFADGRPDWVLQPVAPGPRVGPDLRRLAPDGVIAHAFTGPLARVLADLGKPVANVSGLPDLTPRVGLDNERIGAMVAEHLLDLGVRHFAFTGYRNYDFSTRREAGFRAALRGRALSVACYREKVQVAFDPAGHLWALDEKVKHWVTDLPKPVGVFAANDAWGVQLIEVCRQAGLRVPDDVALVGVDNDDLLCEMARPSLSSVAVPAEQIGFESAALLDRLLSGGRPPAESVLFPPVRVVARQSSDLLALDDPEVAAAVRLIRRAGRPIQVGDILREVAISRRALERRFSAALGRGLGEEIRRVRVERARELLTGTELPMAAVAAQAGYSGVTRLCVAFRKGTGYTPADYRRKFRGAANA